jgi:hypothetical protein
LSLKRKNCVFQIRLLDMGHCFSDWGNRASGHPAGTTAIHLEPTAAADKPRADRNRNEKPASARSRRWIMPKPE